MSEDDDDGEVTGRSGRPRIRLPRRPARSAAEGPVEDEFVEFAERLWLPQLAAEVD